MRPWGFLVLASAASAWLAAGTPAGPMAQAELRLRRDVAHLAAGGPVGHPGHGNPRLGRAVQRLSDGLRAAGLRPRILPFPFLARVEPGEAQALLTKGETDRPLVWGKEVAALGCSADADFRSKPLAFVGFGLQVPGGYDDLAGLQLRDHVAVIARTVPDIPAFAHLPPGQRSLLTRIRRLADAGVAGVIVLEDPRPLGPVAVPVALNLPVLTMPPATLAADCGDLAARLQKIRETGRPQSQDFIYAPWTTLSLSLKLRRIEGQAPGVVALIPGSDPKLRGACIALGAPLDGSSAGSAMILELARELKQAHPRRAILLFCSAGGAEGLVDASAWTRRTRASVAFLLHFQGVDRLDPAALGLRLDPAGAPDAAVEAARRLAPPWITLTVAADGAVGDPDLASRPQGKIPALGFTGSPVDPQGLGQPEAEVGIAGLARLTAYARALALDLANRETLPGPDPEMAGPAGRERD